MSDPRDEIERLVNQFIANGLEVGLVPPSGAVVMAISDRETVVRISSSITGFGTDENGDSAVGVETTVRIEDLAGHE